MLICLSVTPFTILISKLLFNHTSIYFVFHSVLETLYKKLNFYNYSFWLRPALLIKKNNTVNIVLSEHIKYELSKFYPSVKIEYINNPYQKFEGSILSQQFPKIICLGCIGFARVGKGSQFLIDLGKRLDNTLVSLHYIGKLLNCGNIPSDTNIRIHGGNEPLSLEDYDHVIEQMHYCIYFYPKDSYRLTASGALLDSLRHFKPVIAFRNSYFEYIFTLMGNIGYLCDSLDEMQDVINTIIEKKDIALYLEQQKNIIDGMRYFSVKYINEQMKRIFQKNF
jgi:hypothetical protein